MAHDTGFGDGYEAPHHVHHHSHQTATTPYPTSDFYQQMPLPDERLYYPSSQATQYHSDVPLQRTRSRSQTSSSAYYDPTVPPVASTIGQAVNSAFDNSSAASALPEHVINQITEQVRSQVINSLRAEGLGQGAAFQTSPAPQQPQQPQQTFAAPQPQPFTPHSPTSNSTNASAPSRPPIHTPPSPTRRSSNDSSFADHEVQHREARDGRHSSQELHREDFPPRAPVRERDNMRGSDGLRVDLSQRTGDRSEDSGSRTRPPPAPRVLTGEEETVVEKMWQPLFDSEGQPTVRLGQFLRGLALHLVSCL